MEVVVNGEKRQAGEGQTLLEFLQSLGLEPSRVAVELDGRIVKRPEWAGMTLHSGSRLEIVQFVGGG